MKQNVLNGLDEKFDKNVAALNRLYSQKSISEFELKMLVNS